MKTYVIAILIGLGCMAKSGHSQEINYWSIGLQVDQTYFPSKQFTGIGLTLDRYLAGGFSMRYSYLIGNSVDEGTYMFAGAGQAMSYFGARSLFKGDLDGGFVQFLILGAVLPESINYNFPFTRKIGIDLFFSPYGVEYRKDYDTGDETYFVSVEYGIRGKAINDRPWKVVPQLGIKSIYSDTFREAAFTFGFALMYEGKG